MKKQLNQIQKILTSIIISFLLIIILKYMPMHFFGNNILYDASLHVVITINILYILWFFIDQNKSWRIPYFVFALAVLSIISIQRIIGHFHNEIGITLGILIGLISIATAEHKQLRNKFNF